MKTSRVFARREFLRRVALSGGALAIAVPLASRLAGAFSGPFPGAVAGPSGLLNAALGASNPAPSIAAPVVAFFDGSLWLDPSGASPAYEAPSGSRGAALMADLTEHELLSMRPYI